MPKVSTNIASAKTLDLDLRPLTNELGGRLDYGQPLHRSRLLAKTFGGVMTCEAHWYASVFTRGSGIPMNPAKHYSVEKVL